MKTSRKVVLVGAGFVGMSMAYSLLNQGGVNELVLIDVNKDKTVGEEMDLSHGLPYAPHRMKIKAGDYKDCKNANIFPYTYYEVRYCLKSTLKSLGMLISGNGSKDDVSGPIGVAQVIGEISEEAAPYGMAVVAINMLNIALLLSVNLGIMNLLPLPALDGGRLVFLLIEAVRGKPIPPDKEGMVHFAGFVALMVLMVFVMYNDIMRLFA